MLKLNGAINIVFGRIFFKSTTHTPRMLVTRKNKRKSNSSGTSKSKKPQYIQYTKDELFMPDADSSTAMPSEPTLLNADFTTPALLDGTLTIMQKLLMPAKPMLCKPLENLQRIPQELWSDCIMEEKFDGERMLMVVTEDTASPTKNYHQRCYTRNLKEQFIFRNTIEFHEPIHSIVFDGELVYLDTNGQIVSISDTGRRDVLLIQYRIFDVQHLNGSSVMSKPLIERKAILDRYVKTDGFVTLSKYSDCLNHHNVELEYNTAVAAGCEGLIVKCKSESYVSDCRYWLKLKPYYLAENREEYELYAYRFLKDKNSVYNILQCGYFDDRGAFVQVTNVSSGINAANRQRLSLLCNESGFFQRDVIVTLVADKITAKRSLRHPSFKRIRSDLGPIDISMFRRL